MAAKFFVKVDKYDPDSWKQVSNFFVKTTTTAWKSVSDAWVKVKKTGTDAWKKFYTAGTAPDSALELVPTWGGTNNDTLKLQGINYHWSPTPTTLQYRFQYVDGGNLTTYPLTTFTTTSNPSTGSSITLPSASTYVTIANSPSDYTVGGVATYQFEVRGTINGITYSSKGEYQFRTPKAPTVTAEIITSTSIKLTITSATAEDFYATNRYIVYSYDSVAGLVYATGGRGGYGASTSVVEVTITGLTKGRAYTFYVLPITGSTGSTDSNYSGYAGEEAFVDITAGTDYTFSYGKTLYVGTNGYIGLDAGATSDSIASTGTGRFVGIVPGDLYQLSTNSIYYWSDLSKFTIRWEGYHYGQSGNPRYWEATFYDGLDFADVYIVNSNGTEGTEAFVKDGITKTNYTAALTNNQARRVYFDGTTTPTSVLYTPRSVGTMLQVSGLTSGSQDQGYTAIVTASNQSAAVPVNTSAPTISLLSGTANTVGSVYRLSMGSWNGSPTSYTFQMKRNDAGGNALTGFPITIYSPNTYYDWTATASTPTVSLEVYATNAAGNSLTAFSTTSIGPITAATVSQITAPTAKATATLSTSTVKYLDSITWSAGTYNNASSVTSVLLYSTVASNLVAGQTGNTLSSYRTANPYSIATNDPAGTPYIFAVRDTVLGTNGTTYYYFGNQITSANADAVAFSYNTGVSATGGWSATVSGTSQAGASYSITATTGYSVNSSTGAVTVTGLGSNVSSSITVTKSVPGYNSTTAVASGTSSTVTTYTLTYNANNGSTTPTSQTGAQGASITLAANAGTRSGFTFGGWNIGGTTYSGGGSYTFGSANATATAIWNAVFVTPTWNGTMPGWTAGSNFQRITGSSQFKWGWTNGTFSFSGSTTTSRGWNFNGPNSTQLSAGTARTTSLYRSYTTTNDTYTTVQGVSRPYLVSSLRGDVTYNANPRYGSIQPYQFGTDGNEYGGPWTAGI